MTGSRGTEGSGGVRGELVVLRFVTRPLLFPGGLLLYSFVAPYAAPTSTIPFALAVCVCVWRETARTGGWDGCYFLFCCCVLALLGSEMLMKKKNATSCFVRSSLIALSALTLVGNTVCRGLFTDLDNMRQNTPPPPKHHMHIQLHHPSTARLASRGVIRSSTHYRTGALVTNPIRLTTS